MAARGPLAAAAVLVAAVVGFTVAGLTAVPVLPTTAQGPPGVAAAPGADAPGRTDSPDGTGVTGAQGVGPREHYLALGDSLAQGFSPSGDVRAAYPYQHAAGVPGTRLTVLACAGETTVTFVSGRCPYPQTAAVPRQGSQLSAALAFLAAHPGQVSPVTVHLGANDLFAVTGGCDVSPGAPAALDAYETAMASVLSQLSDALAGTGDLVVLSPYDPYPASRAGCPDGPASAALFEEADRRLAAVAARQGVPVVSGQRVFAGAAPDGAPRVCTYTFMCPTGTARPDVHPTREGHAALAGALQEVLGY
ncbi:SGNH/GDSL hydrolase family protein [Aquipuribacter hungaricus]|uniref:SGNH/GDSL hydrolase family protein n=1 Tax=Aquipuribacter hungaricus TaxID=545624 RepID=A0ABV7WIZ5_9MICO